VRWLGACLVGLVLVACGGGEDSSDVPDTVIDYETPVAPEGESLADWRKAASAVCVRDIARLNEAIERHGLAETFDELVAVIDELVAINLERIEDLQAIPTPPERARAVGRINDKLDRAGQSLRLLRDSLREQDFGALQTVPGLLINYANTDEDFTALDVPECVSTE
jgi:hypothetical protein